MKILHSEPAPSPPSEQTSLERARSLCNQAIYTVALQRRRLRSVEPEDEEFVFRPWADLQFYITALRRLRRSASILSRVPSVTDQIKVALDEFDNSIPGLAEMRNVAEHIDDYALDHPKRHHRHIHRKQLQTSLWDGTNFEWLNHKLNIDTAFDAAEKLFASVVDVARRSSSADEN